jgi:ABC-type antimicrobial peptide transport system permease subunit
MIAAVVAGLALLLAGHGVYATALQTTRRRIAELAIRRALGASPRRIVAYVLLDRLRVVAWGLAGFAFFGMLAVALLQNAAGLPPAPPGAYLGIALALAALAIAASARAAQEATTVEPGVLLE